jgi:cytochrome c-type biogenesis protein CcmH
MTGVIIAVILALIAGIGIWMASRSGRTGWEPVAAALLIGLAGYAWQGRPGLAGKPAAANAERAIQFDERLVERRRSMENRFGPAARWLVLSDGLARQGNTRDSVNTLVSALREHPRDADLWVGLGNALVLHEEGVLSPAADYAYRQALRLAPDQPSPRYFYGLALAQSGKLAPARTLWSELAAGLPEGTPFRAELDRNIGLVDQALAQQGGLPAAAP